MKLHKTFESFNNSLKDSKLDEGRKFAKAVNDAREQGLEEFEFNGKTYPVKEKKEKVNKVENSENVNESWNNKFIHPEPGINKDIAHKMLFEKKNYGSLPMNEDAGDFTLEMELERNPEAAVVFHEPAAKSGRKDSALYVHNFYNMKAAKNFQGLIIKMLTHPAFAENPNPRDKNKNHFPEQMTQNMDNVKVMMIKDFIKKYPKATKAIAEWPGAMWDESPWSYMYDRYFNNNATKFKR